MAAVRLAQVGICSFYFSWDGDTNVEAEGPVTDRVGHHPKVRQDANGRMQSSVSLVCFGASSSPSPPPSVNDKALSCPRHSAGPASFLLFGSHNTVAGPPKDQVWDSLSWDILSVCE